MAQIANKNNSINIQDAEKQICIGINFSGFINAINCCTKITGIQQLKEDMRNDIIKGLSKITGTASAIDADELLDNIFYNNGKNFLLKRIKEMKG